MYSNSALGATTLAAPSLTRHNKTLVLGMGNPILGDDGVGVRIAEEVQVALPADAGVDVSEACVGGLSLMERMVGYDTVILVDALCTAPVHPGAVRKLDLDDLRTMGSTQHIASAHDTNLLTALDAGKRMSLPLPQPRYDLRNRGGERSRLRRGAYAGGRQRRAGSRARHPGGTRMPGPRA